MLTKSILMTQILKNQFENLSELSQHLKEQDLSNAAEILKTTSLIIEACISINNCVYYVQHLEGNDL